MRLIYLPAFFFFTGFLIQAPFIASYADIAINWNREGQEFRSPRGKSVAKISIEKQELQVIVQRQTRKMVLSKELLRNGDFNISDTGEWIVWVLKSHAAVSPEDSKNPVILVFRNEKEIQRLGLKDLGKLTISQSTSHFQWNQSTTVDFDSKVIRVKTLESDPREITIHWPNGQIESKQASGSPQRAKTPSEIQIAVTQEYTKLMQAYVKEMQELTEWYANENKKLAEKVDQMTDTEVNTETDKLRANYNRRLVKLQAKMPKAP